jgi:hypothetical protein
MNRPFSPDFEGSKSDAIALGVPGEIGPGPDKGILYPF